VRRVAAAAGGLLALCSAGCDPDVRRLDVMKGADKAANTVVALDCDTGEVCRQERLVKGDSCFAAARRPGTPPVDQQRLYACATDELRRGLAIPGPENSAIGTTRDYRLRRMEALHALNDLRGPGSPTPAPELAKEAAAFRAAYPGDPAGAYYLASAEITQAQDRLNMSGDRAALCRSLPATKAVVDEAGQAPGGYAANLRLLDVDLATLRQRGGCP
jgi:hypothetical protein